MEPGVNHHPTSWVASCFADYLLESPQALNRAVPALMCLAPTSHRLYEIQDLEQRTYIDHLRLQVSKEVMA